MAFKNWENAGGVGDGKAGGQNWDDGGAPPYVFLASTNGAIVGDNYATDNINWDTNVDLASLTVGVATDGGYSGTITLSSDHSGGGTWGNVTWDAGTLDAATYDIIAGAVDLGGGTFGLSTGDHAFASLDLAGVTVTGNGTIEVHGDIIYSAGSNNYTGVITLAASANVSWNADLNNLLAELEIDAGVTATLTAHLRAKKLLGAEGAVVGDFGVVLYPSGDEFYSLGSIAISASGYSLSIYANGANVTNSAGLANVSRKVYISTLDNADRTVALPSVDIGAYALSIYAVTVAQPQVVTLRVSTSLTCGDVKLGATTQNGGGLDVRGATVNMGALAAGHALNSGNLFVMDAASRVSFSSPADGDNITVTGGGGIVASGTVQNVTLATGDRLIAWGCPVTSSSDGVELEQRALGTGLGIGMAAAA